MTETVFVGLSGGVDSSVAATRLKARGYNVVGVFIKVWHPEWLKCNWEQERLDAMRVAAKLDIPFLTCDAEQAYKDHVADYFIREYEQGRTPNPDIVCNQYVKFGTFLEFARERGARYIATGHYAQIDTDGKNHFSLHRGADTSKDQSYFLWTLNQAELSATLFPVGDTEKALIREEAARAGLITSEKKDSQGICFLGDIDIAEFLSHYIDLVPGPVVDESGDTIGEHQGAFMYTLGQRHGFTTTNRSTDESPYFIIAKDVASNTITVSRQRPVVQAHTHIKLANCNWITTPPTAGDTITIQTRYRQTPFPVLVHSVHDTECTLLPMQDCDITTAGQSVVWYDKDECRGGGMIVGL